MIRYWYKYSQLSNCSKCSQIQRQFSYNKFATGDGTWVHYSKGLNKKETNYTNYKQGRRL